MDGSPHPTTATRAALASAKPLRLLLLHPKTLIDSWPVPVDALGEIVKFPSAVYPTLAAMITDLPVSIDIFDGYVARCSFASYKARLAAADLIGISVMSPLKALDTELTLRLARTLNPNVRIILGGNHASAWPERWLGSGADYVVQGEGEIPFRMLIEHLALGLHTLDAIPNLYWRAGQAIQRSTAPLPAFNLDTAPLPLWRGVDLSRYGLGLSDGLAATVEFSRGCPHRCDFCNINTFWNHRQRTKSIPRMIEELEALRARGVREFIFTDDNFGGDERRTIALLETMVERGLDMRFGCFLRGDTVHRHPAFATLAAKAGMRFCMMGIETLDAAWLRDHRKGVRAPDALAMYQSVYAALRSAGITVVGLFILPPAATRGYAAPKGLAGLVCDIAVEADLAALKGSALHDTLAREGRVAKDMFYHDWNLPSILLADGEVQRQQKSIFDFLRAGLSPFILRTAILGPPLVRRFRWRGIMLVAERLACTTPRDLHRWYLARKPKLDQQQRQDRIIATVLGPTAVARAQRRRFWRVPLALRNFSWRQTPRPAVQRD